jgi:hypothetical protein
MAWISVAIVVVILGGLAVLLWLGAKERRVTERELSRITNMPENEARTLALHLLEHSGLFELKPAPNKLPKVELPSSVLEVLNRYEEIVCGEFWVSRLALSQSPRIAGYTKIGEDFEFEEILVQSGDERIFLSYGDLPSNEPLDPVPSLWHEIIKVSGVKVPEGADNI